MTPDEALIIGDLISDLEPTIDKALDGRLNVLAAALYRLQGSANGWCDQEDCGDCPLAPLMCVNGMEERVSALMEKYHERKTDYLAKHPDARKLPVKRKRVKRPQKTLIATPPSSYFNQLNELLRRSPNTFVRSTLDSTSSGHRLSWKRVNAAFEASSSKTRGKKPTPS